MRDPAKTAINKTLPKKTGKRFEKLAKPAFLEALKKHDPVARQSTLVEDNERGTDFLAHNIPIDLTINKEKNNTIHKKEMPDITDGTKSSSLEFSIRTGKRQGKNCKKFTIPTLVIKMDIDKGTDIDDFVIESMPSKWYDLQDNAMKYYCKTTGYDPQNNKQLMTRENTIYDAIDNDIAQNKEQKWMNKLKIKRTGVDAPDFNKPYFGDYEPDI